MAGQLKIGGNIIATHAGSEGAGTVTLDSSTLTIGSNTTIQGVMDAGSIGSNVTGFAGIKVIDQWRLHTNFTGVGNPISSNLERCDTTKAGLIGSAMTESSGIFTFPSTGLYLLIFNTTHSLNNSTRYIGSAINTIISGSATEIAKQYTHIEHISSASTYAMNNVSFVFDCTDTSTDKVSFGVPEVANTNTNTLGSTSQDLTFMRFIRLGDT